MLVNEQADTDQENPERKTSKNPREKGVHEEKKQSKAKAGKRNQRGAICIGPVPILIKPGAKLDAAGRKTTPRRRKRAGQVRSSSGTDRLSLLQAPIF